MDRKIISTLIVNDNDLDCNCDSVTIENMEITNLGFILSDLDKFDLIIYEGKRGSKILRSKFTKNGIIQKPVEKRDRT